MEDTIILHYSLEATELSRELRDTLKDGLQFNDIPVVIAFAAEFIEQYKLPGEVKKQIVMYVIRDLLQNTEYNVETTMLLVESSIDVMIDISNGKYKLRTPRRCLSVIMVFLCNLLYKNK